MRPISKILRMEVFGYFALWLFVANSAFALQEDAEREWSDSTGKFKVQAMLVEVKDGAAFLRTNEGKTLRIPVDRLSAEDQVFLKTESNPFQMVDEGDSPRMAPVKPSGSGSPGAWSNPIEIDWDSATEVILTGGSGWNVKAPNNELGFKPKMVTLQKKANFHEGMHRLVVNSKNRRAVAGFTVSFSVPKPQTRLSLLDLETGKSVHSEAVDAQMRPLALMDDGSTIVMGMSGREATGEIQLWRLKGRKIERTASWTPYPKTRKKFGRTGDAVIGSVFPVEGAKVITLTNGGNVALWNIYSRKPIWYANLNENNFGIDLSNDRKLLAVFNDKSVYVLNALTGETLGSLPINAPVVGWNRIRWSPSGERLLLSSVGDLRVVDVTTGEVETDIHVGDAPVATRNLTYPHEDYALLDDGLLVHLPSKLRVCSYSGASSIRQLGGTAFIAVQGGSGGIVVGSSFPHPAAEKMLATAKDDPTVFLIHPGVAVSIDVSGVPGQYQAEVRQGLEKAAQQSGYKVQPNAAVTLVASITGPKTEAVSYIARGSYVVNQYQSNARLQWQGKTLWQRGGTNIPHMLTTQGDETIEDALKRHGKSPNTSMFGTIKFPEFLQRPREDAQTGANRHNALMSSKFTTNGLVDGK